MTMNGVPFDLGPGEKHRELRYGVNALCILEEKLGKKLGEILGEGMGVSMLRIVFWAGLVWDDKDLTEDGAGLIMDAFMQDGHPFEEVSDLITQGLLKSGFVDPADVKAIEDAAKADGGEDQEADAPLA